MVICAWFPPAFLSLSFTITGVPENEHAVAYTHGNSNKSKQINKQPAGVGRPRDDNADNSFPESFIRSKQTHLLKLKRPTGVVARCDAMCVLVAFLRQITKTVVTRASDTNKLPEIFHHVGKQTLSVSLRRQLETASKSFLLLFTPSCDLTHRHGTCKRKRPPISPQTHPHATTTTSVT